MSRRGRPRYRTQPPPPVRKKANFWNGLAKKTSGNEAKTRYLPKRDLLTPQTLWKLIREDLRCFRIRNSFFELLDEDGTVLKVFSNDPVNEVLKFMLVEGIPDAKRLNAATLKRLTDEIKLVHVPKRLLSLAQRAGNGQKNGMTREDTEILSNEYMVPILESFGYRFSRLGDRIYSPPTVPTDPTCFDSLEDLREYIRSQERLPPVNIRSMKPLLFRKRCLLLRIWAATSTRPLPPFRFEKFRRRRKNGRSFLQFEDESSYLTDEGDLDEVWSVGSCNDSDSAEHSFLGYRPDVFTRMCGEDDWGGAQDTFDCNIVKASTTKIKTCHKSVDLQHPSKCLADLSGVAEEVYQEVPHVSDTTSPKCIAPPTSSAEKSEPNSSKGPANVVLPEEEMDKSSPPGDAPISTAPLCAMCIASPTRPAEKSDPDSSKGPANLVPPKRSMDKSSPPGDAPISTALLCAMCIASPTRPAEKSDPDSSKGPANLVPPGRRMDKPSPPGDAPISTATMCMVEDPHSHVPSPSKSLADLLFLVEQSDESGRNDDDEEEENSLEESYDDDDSLIGRVTIEETSQRISEENDAPEPKNQSSPFFSWSNPVYMACEWVDTQCCHYEKMDPCAPRECTSSVPFAAATPVVVSPENSKGPTATAHEEEQDRPNELYSSSSLSFHEEQEKPPAWNIDDLQAEHKKLQAILEQLNTKMAHSTELKETNETLKAGIEFMKRKALLDEYTTLIKEYEQLQKRTP